MKEAGSMMLPACVFGLAPPVGFEPTAFCSGGRRSNPLS